jgi:hypothetical protein
MDLNAASCPLDQVKIDRGPPWPCYTYDELHNQETHILRRCARGPDLHSVSKWWPLSQTDDGGRMQPRPNHADGRWE